MTTAVPRTSAWRFALVGPGRAGTALALALVDRGATAVAVAGRTPDAGSTRRAADRLRAPAVPVEAAGRGADLVLVATPDPEIAGTARQVAPSLEPGALVLHLSAARGLLELDGVARARPDVEVGTLHPLQSLPDSPPGAARLPGSWCAVEGPAVVERLALSLGMRPFRLDPDARLRYHAAACHASNHLVALLGEVEQLAADTGVPLDAFLPLVRSTVENVAELGPARALTGPVARGDAGTVAAHVDALRDPERESYRALAAAAQRLAEREHDHELTAVLDRELMRS